jgi:hypothetical protein
MIRAIGLLVAGLCVSTGAFAFSLEVPGLDKPLRLNGYLDGLSVIGTEHGANQRPQLTGVVRLDGSLVPGVRIRTEFRGVLGGPPEGGHAGFRNWVHAFQNASPSLEVREASVEVRRGRLSGRLGIQHFAWGKLDGLPPTDVLNPRDFHDPFVTEFEEAKIGVPALQGTVDLPDPWPNVLRELRATLAYIPFAVPPRLPLRAERWFPTGTTLGDELTIGRRPIETGLDRGLDRRCAKLRRMGKTDPFCPPGTEPPPDVSVTNDVDVHLSLRTASRRPPLRFDTGGFAVRLSGRLGQADWNLYHYTGPETAPNLSMRSAHITLSQPVVARPSKDLRLTVPSLHARTTLRQEYGLIHMTGADWAQALGGFTLRAEGAYFQDRPYLRNTADLVSAEGLGALRIRGPFLDQALTRGCSAARPCRGRVALGQLFPRGDAVEWGVGVDTLYQGVFALLQLNQIVQLDATPQLLIDDPETRFTALVRRQFLQDRLELELRTAYTVDSGGWFVFPRVSYAVTDALRVRLGYLALGGPARSFLGQYAANDEVVLQARYSF